MKIFSRRLDYFVFLFILFLPTQLGKHFFFPFSYLSGVRVDYLAPTLYLSDILTIILLLLNIKDIVLFLKNKKTLFFLLVLLMPVAFSQSQVISLYYYLRVLEVILLGRFFKTYIANRFSKKIQIISRAFFLGGIVEACLGVLQLIRHSALQGVFYFFGERSFTLSTPGIAKAALSGVEFVRPYGTFSHPNSMGGFYLLVFVFALYFRRPLLSLIAAILILLSFSKIAIVSFLIISLISFFGKNKNKNCLMCVVAKVAAIIVISIIFLSVRSDPTSLAKRLVLVTDSLKIIIKHPFFGVGPGSYLVAQNFFASRFRDLLNQPVHNVFLLGLAEFGIIPIFIGLTVSFRFGKKIIQRFPFFALALFITGIGDHYWLTLEQNILLLAVMIGVYSFSRARRIS